MAHGLPLFILLAEFEEAVTSTDCNKSKIFVVSIISVLCTCEKTDDLGTCAVTVVHFCFPDSESTVFTDFCILNGKTPVTHVSEIESGSETTELMVNYVILFFDLEYYDICDELAYPSDRNFFEFTSEHSDSNVVFFSPHIFSKSDFIFGLDFCFLLSFKISR